MIVERPALERRVLASLDASRIPVILGGCGMGRTSLLLRIERLLGRERALYLDLPAVASTPERCLASILAACPFKRRPEAARLGAASPREAFDAIAALLDEATASEGGPATFLIDEILDFRTFESFPGLRHVQREIIARLAASPNSFVLASRFTTRAHRLLRDAAARFEVIHVPALDAADTQGLARLFDDTTPEWARAIAPDVNALGAGRPAYVNLLLDALAGMGHATDAAAGLASLLSPDGRLTARCRESYDLRLNRARGFGALKAILGILADDEPLNLTEIAHRMHRTPGSTKDYLSWLEDVDLLSSQRKRYAFDDPLLRLYVRLYGRAVPPTEGDTLREVQVYAQARLAAPAPDRAAALVSADTPTARSGIIEID